MSDQAAAAAAPKTGLRDSLVMSVAALTVIGTLVGAYNSYNTKFNDTDKQIYELKTTLNTQNAELKNDLNLANSRIAFAESIIRTLQANEERYNTDTRNRFDRILESISELKAELTKGIYGRSAPPPRR